MGQSEDVVAIGAGTVWIGRRVVEDTGGPFLARLEGKFGRAAGGGNGWTCSCGKESDTVFVVVRGREYRIGAFGFSEVGRGGAREGRPEITGGGRSRPSVAFFES